MTFTYFETPSILEFQNIHASTQASNVQIVQIASTEKEFSAFGLLKKTLEQSIEAITYSRMENRKKFPLLFPWA